ncbi:hypothetical protein LENED_002479 [Lentinula edodes]|uniref:Uncharacterized protein n=1 Tax=Lentinula edodes TaxID=5353 RepID=A0A1Q3E146_LENED|nr:hypothetical protein LENED_002479 [Lentinula edodes]
MVLREVGEAGLRILYRASNYRSGAVRFEPPPSGQDLTARLAPTPVHVPPRRSNPSVIPYQGSVSPSVDRRRIHEWGARVQRAELGEYGRPEGGAYALETREEAKELPTGAPEVPPTRYDPDQPWYYDPRQGWHRKAAPRPPNEGRSTWESNEEKNRITIRSKPWVLSLERMFGVRPTIYAREKDKCTSAASHLTGAAFPRCDTLNRQRLRGGYTCLESFANFFIRFNEYAPLTGFNNEALVTYLKKGVAPTGRFQNRSNWKDGRQRASAAWGEEENYDTATAGTEENGLKRSFGQELLIPGGNGLLKKERRRGGRKDDSTRPLERICTGIVVEEREGMDDLWNVHILDSTKGGDRPPREGPAVADDPREPIRFSLAVQRPVGPREDVGTVRGRGTLRAIVPKLEGNTSPPPSYPWKGEGILWRSRATYIVPSL